MRFLIGKTFIARSAGGCRRSTQLLQRNIKTSFFQTNTKTTFFQTNAQTSFFSSAAVSAPSYSVSDDFPSIEEEVKDANERYLDKLEIKSVSFGQDPEDKEWGVFTSKAYKKNDVICQMRSTTDMQSYRDSHSVQVDWDKHAVIDLPSRFINHSCDANCGIRDNNDDDDAVYDIVALGNIPEGEALSIDYETFEYKISAFEECLCGSKNCRKLLGGYSKHGPILKEKYGEFIANYLKE